MALAEITPDPLVDYGEVFTRRWVVELILDLVGYTADRDLAAQVVVEPSCGTGAFLLPIVDRLIESSTLHGHELRSIGDAVRAFDLLDANAEIARKAVARRLHEAGLSGEEPEEVARSWVTTGDFLLNDHPPGSADYVVGNPPYIRLESVSRPVMEAYRRVCPTMRGRSDIYVGFIERGLDLLKPKGVLGYICSDRWMRNQYGADLRELISGAYAVDTVITMHDVMTPPRSPDGQESHAAERLPHRPSGPLGSITGSAVETCGPRVPRSSLPLLPTSKPDSHRWRIGGPVHESASA